MGSYLRGASLCAEYLAPEAASTRDMIKDGVTSDCAAASANCDHERRVQCTSLRALITTCDPRRKLATALEWVWNRPFLATGTPSPHQLICTNLGR